MKTLRAALLFACAVAPALPAAELAAAAAQYTQEETAPLPPPAPSVLPRKVWTRIELADGRVLEQARANTADSLTVTFLHVGGITKVDRRILPAELAEVFPFDAARAGREAREQAAARAASAQAQARHEEDLRRRGETLEAVRIATPAPAPRAIPAAPDAKEIETAVRLRARRYFENEKRTGSGATLVFSLLTDLEEPKPVSGWDHRWEVEGVASYKVYDSLGWGSFSSRTRKFRALVEAPPGKDPKIVGFDER